VPILVLAPWAGAAADRYDRKRLLIVFQAVAVVPDAVLASLSVVARDQTESARAA